MGIFFKIHLFLLNFQGSWQSPAAPELPLCAGAQGTEPEQTHRFPSRGWGSATTYCWCQFWGVHPPGIVFGRSSPHWKPHPEADRPFPSFFTEGTAMAAAPWLSSDFTSRQHTSQAIELRAGWVHARWFFPFAAAPGRSRCPGKRHCQLAPPAK